MLLTSAGLVNLECMEQGVEEMLVCVRCRGHRHAGRRKSRCTLCGGRGSVARDVAEDYQRALTVPCPECNDDASITHTGCLCGGAGVVSIETEESWNDVNDYERPLKTIALAMATPLFLLCLYIVIAYFRRA